MRIIAGALKGRRLYPPESLPVRPTTDMARESLFDILNNYVDYEDCDVLDLFAGTGAVSLEFVSRGARTVTAVDSHAGCVDFIKRSAIQFSASNLRAVRSDVFELMKRAYMSFDIVFADPPYELETLPTLPDLLFQSGLLREGGIFVLEHSKRYAFDAHPHFWQHRRYGKVNFTFFADTQQEADTKE